jgi:hypothetical protein
MQTLLWNVLAPSSALPLWRWRQYLSPKRYNSLLLLHVHFGEIHQRIVFCLFFTKIYVMFRSSVIYAFVMWLHCLSYRCLKASVHSNKTTKVYFRWVCDYSLQERSELGKGKTKIDRILTLNTHVRVQADYRGFMQISVNKTSFYK